MAKYLSEWSKRLQGVMEVETIPLLICYISPEFREEQRQKLGEAYDKAVRDNTEHGIDVVFIDVKSKFGPFLEKGLVFNILLQPSGYSKRTKEKIAQACNKATLEILGREMMMFFRDMDSSTGNVAEKDHLGRFLITE